MKFFLSTLTAVSIALSGGVTAMAETDSNSKTYETSDIESLEAERYWQVNKKWEVEIEFTDGKDETFYVYNIDDKNELYEEIQDEMRDRYNLKPLTSYISSILEFDEDDFFENENKEEIDEIEAEPYKNIKGKWEIEAEYQNGKEKKFYVYEVEDRDDLVSKIAKELGLLESEVEDVLDVDDDDFEENDDRQTFGVKKITAERVWSVIGKWEIKAQFEDSSKNTKVYYVYNIESEDQLLEQIAGGLVLERDELKGIDIEIKDNDFDGRGYDEKDDKDKKEKDEDKKDTISNSAKEAQIAALEKQIQDLLQLLIALLTKQMSL